MFDCTVEKSLLNFKFIYTIYSWNLFMEFIYGIYSWNLFMQLKVRGVNGAIYHFHRFLSSKVCQKDLIQYLSIDSLTYKNTIHHFIKQTK